jgi:hypothetical protein
VILDGYLFSLALLVAPALTVVVVGTLVIRLIARAAERRLATVRLARAERVAHFLDNAMHGRPRPIEFEGEVSLVEYGPEPAAASLRPFVAWIAWAFVAGMAVALLAQRAVGS